MAKGVPSAVDQAQMIISDICNGHFSKIYVLMGDEPFYPDMVCDEIIANAIPEEEKDFNEVVCYGQDVDAEAVISAARRFPMMADRQLVVVKDAQQVDHLEDLAMYCAKPLDSTVLVLLFRNHTLDKRKALYKAALKEGVVLESPLVRDYELSGWIMSYYSSRGLKIAPAAAALLAEYIGSDLSAIALATDKMLKNLPEGTTEVGTEDVERNIGVSRQFSVFELTKTLSYKDARKSLNIAKHLGDMARFQMPAAVSALFMHFYRILTMEAAVMSSPGRPLQQIAASMRINPYFLREYETAMANYPLRKCMGVISLLNEYDFKGKGGDVGPDTAPGELLVELVTRILNS